MGTLQAQDGINDLRTKAMLAISARLKSLDLTQLLIYGPNVPASVLPFLAWQLDVAGPYWQLLAGTSNQSALVKSAIALHKLAGTPQAIVNLIANAGYTLLVLEEGQNSWGGTVYPPSQGWAVFRIIMILAEPGTSTIEVAADWDSIPDLDFVIDVDDLTFIDVSSGVPVPITPGIKQLLIDAVNFFKPQRSVLDLFTVLSVAKSGLTWASQGEVSTSPFNAVGVDGADTTLAVDTALDVWKSTDGGLIWTNISTLPFGAGRVASIVFGKTIWLATIGNAAQIAISSDGGATWTLIDVTGLAVDANVFAATDGAGTWLLASDAGGTSNIAFSNGNAADGTWAVPIVAPNQGASWGILWDGAQFVFSMFNAAGSDTRIVTTPDGFSLTYSDNTNGIGPIAFGNGIYLAGIITSAAIRTAAAGSLFQLAGAPNTPTTGLASGVTAVAAANKLFFAFDDAANVSNSFDCFTWYDGTLSISDAIGTADSVTYEPVSKNFIAAGDGSSTTHGFIATIS